MMNDQMASIPGFPRVFKNNCPIGNGSVDVNRSSTDVVAKDAAMYNSHPKNSVNATDAKIAIGATRAAPETSSEICAAESSEDRKL